MKHQIFFYHGMLFFILHLHSIYINFIKNLSDLPGSYTVLVHEIGSAEKECGLQYIKIMKFGDFFIS